MASGFHDVPQMPNHTVRTFYPMDPMTSKISSAQGRAGIGGLTMPRQPFAGAPVHMVTVRPRGTGRRAHTIEVNLVDPGSVGQPVPAIRTARY